MTVPAGGIVQEVQALCGTKAVWRSAGKTDRWKESEIEFPSEAAGTEV